MSGQGAWLRTAAGGTLNRKHFNRYEVFGRDRHQRRRLVVAQSCYTTDVREISFTPIAVRQLQRLPKTGRTAILEGIQTHLVEADPAKTTRNKFRLRRPSEHADFELRLGQWRVFYRVLEADVIIALVGKKEGNRLLIDGEEFVL